MLCLFSMGGNDGGFSVYVLDNVFTYGCNHVADSYYDVPASGPLPEDHHVLSVEFRPTGPADLGAIALPDYQPPPPLRGSDSPRPGGCERRTGAGSAGADPQGAFPSVGR
jgi:hypothetical protein